MSREDEAGLDAHEFLCYLLLRELDDRQREGRSVTRTQFLKLPCIADRLLSDRFDVDVELPRYWYRYGEILNEQPLDGHYYTVTPGEWGGHSVQPAPGITEDAFDVPETVEQPVRTVVRDVVGKFANQQSETVKEYQYEQHAPNRFVVLFDEFREFVRNQDQQNAALSDFADRALESPEKQGKEHLDELLAEYPPDLYSDMYDLFLRWEDTTRLLVEDGAFDRVEELLEDFWETFSKVELRFHHGQNTPIEQRRRWSEARDDEITGFDRRLGEVRESILVTREPGEVVGSLLESSPSDDLV